MSSSSVCPAKRVRVCVRVRPPPLPSSSSSPSSLSSSSPSVVVNAAEQTLSVVTNAATGAGTCFRFDRVLDARVAQAGVYEAAVAELVSSVLAGYNATVLAYGQTGAGKTYTMSGARRGGGGFEDRGVTARALSGIFQHIHRDRTHAYVVRVSYMEVYNEQLYDLLNFHEGSAAAAASAQRVAFGGGPGHQLTESGGGGGENNPGNNLVIQENAQGQTFVRGLTRPLVKTEEDALDLLFQGETNRTIAEHCLNASSTRSHCIFTVYLEKKRVADEDDDGDGTDAGEANDRVDDVAVSSKLHLVDLAGSERMKKTQVAGAMLKEATHINKSLTFLEQVVLALGEKKRQHIPYRQSPLTNLLKDSLGGNCQTMLIACVWPEASHNDQTLATLKFATRMMRVKTSAVVNVASQGRAGHGGALSADAQAMLQKSAQEIQRLKEELALHDSLSGRSLVDYDLRSLQSAASRGRYREQLQEFIQDTTKPPDIVNLTQTRQLLAVFREMYLANTAPAPSAMPPHPPSSAPSAMPAPTESRMVKQFRSLRLNSPDTEAAATKEDRHHLPTIQRASPIRKQNQTRESGDANDSTGPSGTPAYADGSWHLPPLSNQMAPPSASRQNLQTTPPERKSDKELLELFKQQTNPKPESLLDLEVAKQNLRQSKGEASDLGLEINRIKLEIDALTTKLQDASEKTLNGGDRPEVSDEDTAADYLVVQLKCAKKRYRETFERFQEKKSEVKYLLKIKEQMLQNVTREFEVWKSEWLRTQEEHV